MRCNGSICKEMVREFGAGGGIFKAGGPPATPSSRFFALGTLHTRPCSSDKPQPLFPVLKRLPAHLPIPSSVALLALLLAANPSRAQAQRAGVTSSPPADRLAGIYLEEDSRALSGIHAITSALSDPVASVRAAGVRALGRLQSLENLDRIESALSDPDHSVLLEAINAVAQAAQGLRQLVADSTTPAADAEAIRVRRTAAEERVAGLAKRAAEAASGTEAQRALTRGLVGRSLGRIPWSNARRARTAESAIVELLGGNSNTISRTTPAALAEGVLHGLYGLARARRTLGNPAPAAVAAMRSGLTYKGSGGSAEAAARVRRLALLGLGATGSVSHEDLDHAISDSDEQVRRLAVTYQAALSDSSKREELLGKGMEDGSWLVRHEAVRGWRAFAASRGCAPLLRATSDAEAHVALVAIDGLGSACNDGPNVAQRLLDLIDANMSDSPARARGRSGWHVHAHALLALARSAPERARDIVRRDATSQLWSIRVYAMRAAAVLRDSETLSRGASDSNGNVREAALIGLSSVLGHGADSIYVSALASRDYQVVLAAASALRGATPEDRDPLVLSLLDALDRISAERRETSRDPRMALLERIAEQGDARHIQRLEPYLADFDTAVATLSADILTPWMGRPMQPKAQLLQRPAEEIAPLMRGELRARITMARGSGGGSFEIRLFPREAPYTVARFVRLARAGYYNGLTFHRVEPGFVIQGGSPSATEYVGDGPFMRDELGTRSHTRGTLGISTRGRDTGDAQIFMNLTDNFRLDHDYTVFGEIVRGREVAERVLEADVIEKVEISSAR